MVYLYKDYLAILYGWNVPQKAKRPWELVEVNDMIELSPMCLTANKEINKVVEIIWSD